MHCASLGVHHETSYTRLFQRVPVAREPACDVISDPGRQLIKQILLRMGKDWKEIGQKVGSDYFQSVVHRVFNIFSLCPSVFS